MVLGWFDDSIGFSCEHVHVNDLATCALNVMKLNGEFDGVDVWKSLQNS